jgi:phosphatidylserine/phosphatidylglycerophosphate/cardiolipin synthase-like enzyme
LKKIVIVLFLIIVSNARADEFDCIGKVSVFFSPHGNTAKEIISEIDAAKNEILIQAYVLTNRSIANALIQASKRNVNVIIILDQKQSKSRYSQKDYLLSNNIIVLLDNKHNIAHNKIIIIDQIVLITGSYNFSYNAENKNSENVLVIKNNTPIIEYYVENFRVHQTHSK